MAKRRRVGNLLALAVLSVVVQRPMHPYEMASVIRARGKDQDMQVKWGSFYTVVRNLERHGLLEATGSAREGARPERTVYRITEAGREELADWARELVGTPEQEHPSFEAGLSVMAVLGPDEVVELLRGRLELVQAEIERRRAQLAAEGAQIPRLFLLESEYDLAVREAEATWVRALLDDLASGAFPGLDQWRAYQATGEIPQDLTDIAERGAP